MKFILSGTSGFIGHEILNQLLQLPSITSIIVLSRRPLPDIESRDSRIQVIVLQSFLSYPDSVIQNLAGAKACLWALGGIPTNPTPAGKHNEVNVQYPLAAVRALLEAAKTGGEDSGNGKMRFLFISVPSSERNQTIRLWFWEEGRRSRGLAETKLLELTRQSADTLETVIFKPAVVVGSENPVPEFVLAASRYAIRVNELAAAMIDIALRGSAVDTLENAEIRQTGKQALKK